MKVNKGMNEAGLSKHHIEKAKSARNIEYKEETKENNGRGYMQAAIRSHNDHQYRLLGKLLY